MADRNRLILGATCQVHPGVPGFANLLVKRLGSGVLIDPHAIGICTMQVTEAEIRRLWAACQRWGLAPPQAR